MDKQLENGYKDTALEIAGKCRNIKSGYCILLKSTVLYFSSSSMHVLYVMPVFGVFTVDFILFSGKHV